MGGGWGGSEGRWPNGVAEWGGPNGVAEWGGHGRMGWANGVGIGWPNEVAEWGGDEVAARGWQGRKEKG